MRVKVWKYESDGPRVWFRGGVREYSGAQYIDHPCPKVHPTRGAAIRDAERLKIKLSKRGV